MLGEIPTKRSTPAEGWLYLAGVIDAFSKRVVGYAIADNMKTDLVLQALRSAATQREPPTGLIHHGDRGSQHTSYAYQRELETYKMLPSFTGQGACFDNALIESFWSTLKREPVYRLDVLPPVMTRVSPSLSTLRFTTTASACTARSITRHPTPSSYPSRKKRTRR